MRLGNLQKIITFLIACIDVACLLSRWEGFGLVLPEYMIAGKPIVASRVDAIPDIIKDEENGLLVEVDDVDGAVSAVMRLYKDSELKRKLVIQETSTVYDKFDAKRVSNEHNILFRLLVQGENL